MRLNGKEDGRIEVVQVPGLTDSSGGKIKVMSLKLNVGTRII